MKKLNDNTEKTTNHGGCKESTQDCLCDRCSENNELWVVEGCPIHAPFQVQKRKNSAEKTALFKKPLQP